MPLSSGPTRLSICSCASVESPVTEALLHEVAVVADLTTYYAKCAARVLNSRQISLHLMKHRRSYLHYVPRGVVGVISPWNYPFQIPMRDVITD